MPKLLSRPLPRFWNWIKKRLMTCSKCKSITVAYVRLGDRFLFPNLGSLHIFSQLLHQKGGGEFERDWAGTSDRRKMCPRRQRQQPERATNISAVILCFNRNAKHRQRRHLTKDVDHLKNHAYLVIRICVLRFHFVAFALQNIIWVWEIFLYWSFGTNKFVYYVNDKWFLSDIRCSW